MPYRCVQESNTSIDSKLNNYIITDMIHKNALVFSKQPCMFEYPLFCVKVV